MPNGTLTVYASVAGQAAPLPGVRITVRDESGALLAQRTTDAAGAAAAIPLPAPDTQYSLDEANTAVRPYAVYRLEAALDGWQAQVLDGVQVFDGQQTVARLAFLPIPPPWCAAASGRSRRSRRTRCLTGTAAAAPRRRPSSPAY